MKLERHPANPILEKNKKNHWEAGSVLNPNVFYENGIFRMVYRATNDIRVKEKGGYVSSIGYAESTDGIQFTRSPKPLISPDQPYENRLGCEDARVTKIDDTYFLYYTAVAGENDDLRVRIALATSKDFKNWKKHGIVGPQFTRSKAATLFSEKINGKYIGSCRFHGVPHQIHKKSRSYLFEIMSPFKNSYVDCQELLVNSTKRA